MKLMSPVKPTGSNGLKIGAIVTRKDLPDGARYVVISGACREGDRWEAGAVWSQTGRAMVPDGFHVQELETGRLATFKASSLAVVK